MPDIQTFSQLVYHDIISHGLPICGSSVTVAVSGGADSVALLFSMHELRKELQVRLHVAHFDHAMRAESANDASFVRSLAESLGLDFISRRSEQLSPQSSEEAARNERRRFLFAAMEEAGSQFIATGHTADDRAETVLFRVIRGTGTEGLASILWRRGSFVRPLLGRTHQEAEDYLNSLGQKWLEDATNTDTTMARNYIRHRLLPDIRERLNPKVSEALNRLADLAETDFSYIDSQAEQLVQKAEIGENKVVFSCPALRSEHPAIVWQALRKAMQTLTASGSDINYEMVQRAYKAILSSSMGEDIGLGIHLESTDMQLLLKKAPGRSLTAGYRINLKPGQFCEIADTGYSFYASDNPYPEAVSCVRTTLPLDRLLFRNWKPGDRIKPVGMAGTKKIQDVFVDAKVPRGKRGRIPLLADAETDEIIWVPGLCISSKASTGNGPVIYISLTGN